MAATTTSISSAFDQLDVVLVNNVLRFLCAREVEAAAVAAPVVAREVLPRFPGIWRTLFVRRWETLNFPLGSESEREKPELVIDRRLRRCFPRYVKTVCLKMKGLCLTSCWW